MFRESIKIIRGKAGIYHPYGRIIMTKVLHPDQSISEVIKSIILLLKFPGSLYIDFQGFLEDSTEDLVFCYGSQNSSLPLQNQKNHIFLDSTEACAETIKYFSDLSNNDIRDLWFNQHSKIGGLSASGFTPQRLVTANFFYEPSEIHVDKVFKK